jgi:hypothetical protein
MFGRRGGDAGALELVPAEADAGNGGDHRLDDALGFTRPKLVLQCRRLIADRLSLDDAIAQLI